ncbi:uncharacterized protein LOC103729794 isoform X2 [Nannospalax galili]|nr:uncharacterized protein LOC103729794 isoform X2 [Nannospalax galili]
MAHFTRGFEGGGRTSPKGKLRLHVQPGTVTSSRKRRGLRWSCGRCLLDPAWDMSFCPASAEPGLVGPLEPSHVPHTPIPWIRSSSSRVTVGFTWAEASRDPQVTTGHLSRKGS